MPNEKLSFAEYYKRKYGVSIEDPSQPLLRMSNARARETIQQINMILRFDFLQVDFLQETQLT